MAAVLASASRSRRSFLPSLFRASNFVPVLLFTALSSINLISHCQSVRHHSFNANNKMQATRNDSQGGRGITLTPSSGTYSKVDDPSLINIVIHSLHCYMCIIINFICAIHTYYLSSGRLIFPRPRWHSGWLGFYDALIEHSGHQIHTSNRTES